MMLKSFQRSAINDLNLYLNALKASSDLELAWHEFWSKKDVVVGENAMPRYQKNLSQNIPQICLKIPTGGGKTFVACNAIKPISNEVQRYAAKFVVWLVPSDAILSQTLANLKNLNHPYRVKLDTDFNARVNVFSKDELLNGALKVHKDTLNIAVLSFASVRITNKEARKIYQENGTLLEFEKILDKNLNLNDESVSELSLINVVRNFSPIVIVDESHNAVSDLSINMIEIFNPSFVLELSATPKQSSNVIHYASAVDLKNENMVKLPVYVINANDVLTLILNAVNLRNGLEAMSQDESEYARPIVLFQAEPKHSDDAQTFESIKQKLIKAGIKSEQIAIKTAQIDELKGVDLLSKECEIRYIITVNALKEGWDCSFAYVLASIANKNSKTDVEQIVGRILRQPNAKRFKNENLNMSYVLTSSNEFLDTVKGVVKGLNSAGFSKDDYRVYEDDLQKQNQTQAKTDNQNEILDFELPDLALDSCEKEAVQEILKTASDVSVTYAQEVKQSAKKENFGGYMKREFHLRFSEVVDLRLPKFVKSMPKNIFENKELKEISKDDLIEGFRLANKDAQVLFDSANLQIFIVDIDKENIPKYQKENRRKNFIEYLKNAPTQSTQREIKNKIVDEILSSDSNKKHLNIKDLQEYVSRVIGNLNDEQKVQLIQLYEPYAQKIVEKIKILKTEYRAKKFFKMLETGEIFIEKTYKMPSKILPANFNKNMHKMLYEAQKDDLNTLENEILQSIIALENIKWWYRNDDNNGFCINGFINHYPDFLIATNSGKILAVEIKGDDRTNFDSINKVRLGRKWADMAGENFRYFMVFDKNKIGENGAYTIDEFLEIAKEL